MSDCEQEQLDELESLECLYPSTFKRDKQSSNAFTLDIYPHETDSNEPNHVGIKLHIKYSPTYPTSIPNIRITSIKGITDKQISHVHSLAMEIATMNLGTPSMFSICTELQEYLIQNNIPMNTSLHDEMLAKKELQKRLQRLQFGDENKNNELSALDIHSVQDFDKSYQRSKGTPVTKKSFEKWQKLFLISYRAKEELLTIEKYGNDANRDLCTGKQIFEQMARERLNFESIADLKIVPNDELIFTGENCNRNNENCNEKKQKKKKKRKKRMSNSVCRKVVDGRNCNHSKQNNSNDNQTVLIYSDESLFLDMEMPDI